MLDVADPMFDPREALSSYLEWQRVSYRAVSVNRVFRSNLVEWLAEGHATWFGGAFGYLVYDESITKQRDLLLALWEQCGLIYPEFPMQKVGVYECNL